MPTTCMLIWSVLEIDFFKKCFQGKNQRLGILVYEQNLTLLHRKQIDNFTRVDKTHVNNNYLGQRFLFILSFLVCNPLEEVRTRDTYSTLYNRNMQLKDPSQPQYLARAKCNIRHFICHLNSDILYVEKKSSSILMRLLYRGLKLPQTLFKIIGAYIWLVIYKFLFVWSEIYQLNLWYLMAFHALQHGRGRPKSNKGTKIIILHESTFRLWNERKDSLNIKGLSNSQFAEILLHQNQSRSSVQGAVHFKKLYTTTKNQSQVRIQFNSI